jgi:G3E family GTPase
MIPICLVTGFLGSGKTSFLKAITARHVDERIVYLVNEVSPLDVDGALLEELDEGLVAIPGGSIFCRCLVTEFIARLTEIPKRFGTVERPVVGVVIESSGIADPRVIAQLLAETKLDGVYDLATVITVVDPASLPKLVHTLPNIAAQIEAADVVLLNKTDLFDDEEVAATEALVREINPDAEVIRTVRCEADLELFGEAPARDMTGDYAPCMDPNYEKLELEFRAPVDMGQLMAGLTAARDDIYRAKGFVPTPSGLYYLDMSAAGLTTQLSDRDDVTLGLAIITRGDDCPLAQKLAASIEAGELDARA